jgi:hypothetical protein
VNGGGDGQGGAHHAPDHGAFRRIETVIIVYSDTDETTRQRARNHSSRASE